MTITRDIDQKKDAKKMIDQFIFFAILNSSTIFSTNKTHPRQKKNKMIEKNAEKNFRKKF